MRAAACEAGADMPWLPSFHPSPPISGHSIPHARIPRSQHTQPTPAQRSTAGPSAAPTHVLVHHVNDAPRLQHRAAPLCSRCTASSSSSATAVSRGLSPTFAGEEVRGGGE